MARLLVERGYKVRALCRPTSQLRELDVERVEGDLRDPPSLALAVKNCELVFHVAADYRLWSKNPDDLYKSNVDGTRSLLEAAERAGVQRVVYTSTVGCIGMPKGQLGDENTPVSIADMSGHYKRSKWLAEQVALEKSRRGLPIVIVNPTAPVGDHDWKPTPTGKIIVDFLRNEMPAYIDTGLNISDARDTALGHLLAAEKGRPGERYILGSENLTLKEILSRLARLSGRARATNTDSLRLGLCHRRRHNRLGQCHRPRTPCPARSCQNGPQEDVRFPREGNPRTGLLPRPGRNRPQTRCRLVHRERLRSLIFSTRSSKPQMQS